MPINIKFQNPKRIKVTKNTTLYAGLVFVSDITDCNGNPVEGQEQRLQMVTDFEQIKSPNSIPSIVGKRYSDTDRRPILANCVDLHTGEGTVIQAGDEIQYVDVDVTVSARV